MMIPKYLSFSRLARTLGVHRSTVGRWFSGKRKPQIASLVEILNALHEDQANLNNLIKAEFRNALLTSSMRQVDLAEKLGISQASISYWKTGARTPDLERIKETLYVLNNAS